VPDLTPAQVGLRVSVRRRDRDVPGPRSLRDTVGRLEAVDEASLHVRRRDGALVTIARADVVAARVVPPATARLRRASDVEVAALEQISSLGWPALETRQLGDWVLRSAQGFTGRANSVLPLGSPGQPIERALAEVVSWYRARGVTPRFQVPLPLCQDLDDELATRGWTGFDPVRVLVADLDAVRMLTDRRDGVGPPRVSSRPDDAWLAAYHYRDQELPAVAREVMSGGAEPLFVSLADGTGVVAVARGAVDEGWLGVTAVEVAAHARRLGLGRTLMHDLLEAGRTRGARFTYLQVAEENVPARAFYERLGFRDHHGYHYRRWQS
jgi:ribosomal protein S18 acetylase RimI-like enzyme